MVTDQPTTIRLIDVTASTNVDAVTAFMTGQSVPEWFVALRQTQGKGRRGRAWTQSEGNFAGSLLWPLGDGSITPPAALSFIVALALADAVEACGVPSSVIELKWPNDLLLGQAKAAGILIEQTSKRRDGGRAAIIGIGVNLKMAPDISQYSTSSVSAYTPNDVPTPQEFAFLLDSYWQKRWALFQDHGFGPISAAWTSRAAGIGETVWIKDEAGQDCEGVLIGIDTQGAARIATDQGERAFFAGDISLRLSSG